MILIIQLIILLSLCLGLINAAKGSGIKGGKVAVILSMLVVAYIFTNNLIWTLLFPLPLCISWWVPGGTGGYMPWVISKFGFLGLGDNTWRFFEVFEVFIYSLIYLTISYLLVGNYVHI